MEVLADILGRPSSSEFCNIVTHPLRFVSNKLQYYTTAAYPCSYLDGQQARSLVAAPSDAIDAANYSKLIEHGFRRSGSYVYRPHCDHCDACLSARVPVNHFKPNRSQQRSWKQHASLSCRVIQPVFSDEHYVLYTQYQQARHAGGGMDIDDEVQYTDFLVKTNVSSFMVEFRQVHAENTRGELVMVSIIDQVDNGLSAVYTFYTPTPGFNLGTFNVLWQIRYAASLGLRYVYLGYWIRACAKMSYKARFKPCELFVNEKWEPASPQFFTK